MTDLLSFYARVYEAVVPGLLCKQLIEEFEQNRDRAEIIESDGCMQFEQLTWGEEMTPARRAAMALFIRTRERYRADVGFRGWPERFGWERPRLKRYAPGEGYFAPHHDIADFDSASRLLGLLLYLNDVDEGGETYFPDLDLSVTPRIGRMLVFPPSWQWWHEGRAPVSGAKYILHTYVRFV